MSIRSINVVWDVALKETPYLSGLAPRFGVGLAKCRTKMLRLHRRNAKCFLKEAKDSKKKGWQEPTRKQCLAKGCPAWKCYPISISLNGEAFMFGSRQFTVWTTNLSIYQSINLLCWKQCNLPIYQCLELLSWLSCSVPFPFAFQGHGLQLCSHITMFTRCG